MATSVEEDFGMETFVGNQTTVSAMRSNVVSRIRVNEAAVVVANNENVRVTNDGRNKETAGRVRVDLAGGGLAVGVQEMCF